MDLKALPKGKIKMKSNWHQWCRLCGCDYPDNLDVFTIQTRNLVMAIGKYFWVDIKKNDELSQYLCRECHNLLEYLISFSEQVHRVQRMFEHLQTDNNLEEQRVEADAKDISEFKCILCSKVYRKATPYKRHLVTLHGICPKDLDNCQCKQCDITFSTVNQLVAHHRTHMTTKEKKDNTCPMCSKVFTTAGALNRHIAGTHNKLTPYTCDICGKAVKTLASLKDHKLVHTDACPFECDVCHRRFKNKARLRVHSDSHTEGYDCDICGMILKTRRTLYTHREVHSDERKCKCEVCGATFKRTKTLKSHLILHTGIRPYKCNFCGAEFANGSNCRMHKRKKHPKELAEEESRRVIRSTRLPLIDDLTEASKRIKTPARKAAIRTNTSKPKKSINPSVIAMEEENEYLLDNLVGEM
ncbi:uncharacterized protein Dwil_GK14371 [Drosophila willistoni]|uniref:Uncharacterized protein n=1 Tax=Drosophila willistoni TaxID=7260 RepID=B4NIZ7_DROWI|nr:uncharacterized protein Dwil_GK14371 [Drosophila willistoni]